MGASPRYRCFFFQAEDGIRGLTVTGVQTCALPISRWKPVMNVRQRCEALAQAASISIDPAFLPHERANGVRGDLGGAAVWKTGHGPAPGAPWRWDHRHFLEVASDSLGENETLEERVRRQPVGTVDARARHLAARVETVEARAAGQIGDDSTHHVVRRGRDGYEIDLRIDASRGAE